MIRGIVDFALSNRVLVLAIALTAAGIYATVRTPIDAIPDLSDRLSSPMLASGNTAA